MYLSITKEARICNEEKAVSSISGARKTGQLHIKLEPHHTQKQI